MKKQLLTAAMAAQLLTQLHAGGDFKEVEPAISEVEVIEAEESKFYIVAKGMMTLGDEMTSAEALLDGDTGYGFGIDLGYRISESFAIECDYSYSSNTITETRMGREAEEYDADYQTLALDAVYTYDVTEMIGLFAKAGFEYEWESIDDLEEDNYDFGMVFGLGVEVEMTEAYKFIVEYEHSTIDGPRGDAIFAGVMFNF
jgi:opacity protein-like surface antigen